MKSALMSVKDDAQTCEGIARLTEDELHALTKDAFFWGMHPVAMYELRYVLTQLKGRPSYVATAACIGIAVRARRRTRAPPLPTRRHSMVWGSSTCGVSR